MKKLFVLFLSICALSFVVTPSAYSQKPVRVLFIGNSLTYSNDIPQMVADIAAANQIKMVFDMHAPAGETFAQHAVDRSLLRKIAQQTWDIVVLQGQNSKMVFGYDQVQRDVLAPARSLCQTIRKSHPEARIIFYQTMAYKTGYQGNEQGLAEVGTYSGMQKHLNLVTTWLSGQNKAGVARVGGVWQVLREADPDLNLYSDDIHPNQAGSYLAACVLSLNLFDKSPFKLPVLRGIDAQVAKRIQDAVYPSAI